MNSDEYRRIIMELAKGTNINNLRNEHIDELLLPIPTIEQQSIFVELLKQSDKSKFAVRNLSNLNLSSCLVLSRISDHIANMSSLVNYVKKAARNYR